MNRGHKKIILAICCILAITYCQGFNLTRVKSDSLKRSVQNVDTEWVTYLNCTLSWSEVLIVQDILTNLKPNCTVSTVGQGFTDTLFVLSCSTNSTDMLTTKTRLTIIKRVANQLSDDLTECLQDLQMFHNDYIYADSVFTDVKVQNVPDIWNLDRIDQQYLPLDHTYSYTEEGSENIQVFVMDSGINISHPEFEGRASHFINLVSTEDENDYSNHGTPVASIVGGKTVGVAKNVSLFNVKVLSRRGGSVANVILGIMAIRDYKITNNNKCNRLAMVVCMSLGARGIGTTFPLVDNLVDDLVIKYRIAVIAAAGNSATNNLTSPASAKYVLVVGATDINDLIPSFSNYGSGVDIYAPGVNIRVATSLGSISSGFSGTSAACPHVAGVVALEMARQRKQNFRSYPDGFVAQKRVLVMATELPPQNKEPNGFSLLFAPLSIIPGDKPREFNC